MSRIRKLKRYIDFFDGEILHYASSLSFHTILSFVPIMLISLSIFTKMPSYAQYHTKLMDFVFNSLIPTQQDMIVSHINDFLQNTGEMGTIGLVFVLYIAIMFFLDYEAFMARIFKTKERTIFGALSTYWTMVTIMPLGLALSFFFTGNIQKLLDSTTHYGSVWFNFLLPYLVIWALFGVMYVISANKQIKFKAIALSSLCSSLVWHVSKIIFIFYVTYNKTYLSIYGSFSILMFFILWVYFSWIIYLYGAKLCNYLHVYNKISPSKKTKID